MKLSNVQGVLEKEQLDKGKIKSIQYAAFKLYPVIEKKLLGQHVLDQ